VPPERPRGWGGPKRNRAFDNLQTSLFNSIKTLYNSLLLRNFISRNRTSRVGSSNKNRPLFRRASHIARFCTLLPGQFCQSAPTWSAKSLLPEKSNCDLQASVVLSLWLVPSSDCDKRKLIDAFPGRLLCHEKYS